MQILDLEAKNNQESPSTNPPIFFLMLSSKCCQRHLSHSRLIHTLPYHLVVFQTIQRLFFNSHYFFVTLLLLELKEDFGLITSFTKDFSLFLKFHISHSFFQYSSNSVLSFAWSISLAVGTNFKPLDNNEISECREISSWDNCYIFTIDCTV